jgi:excisionase family DNA binding protein
MARPMPVQQNSRLELLTTAQAAEVLNVHPNTVRNWADSALLPSYRIGPRRDRRFRRQDVESLLTESGNGHDHS